MGFENNGDQKFKPYNWFITASNNACAFLSTVYLLWHFPLKYSPYSFHYNAMWCILTEFYLYSFSLFFSGFRSLMTAMVSKQQWPKQLSLTEEGEVRWSISNTCLLAFLWNWQRTPFLRLYRGNTMVWSSTDKLIEFYLLDSFESFTRDMRSRFDEGKYCFSETFWS